MAHFTSKKESQADFKDFEWPIFICQYLGGSVFLRFMSKFRCCRRSLITGNLRYQEVLDCRRKWAKGGCSFKSLLLVSALSSLVKLSWGSSVVQSTNPGAGDRNLNPAWTKSNGHVTSLSMSDTYTPQC